jgi:hypothetical protein
MALKYADRLAWARELFERRFTILDVQVANLREEYQSRAPHQDDEDDTLEAAANLILFASEQVDEAIRTLKEGS